MDDNTQQILYEIGLNADQYIQNVQELAVQSRNAKATLEDLKASTGVLSTEFTKQQAVVTNLNKEYKNAKDVLAAHNIVVDESTGNVQKLAAAKKVLTSETAKESQANSQTSKSLAEVNLKLIQLGQAVNVGGPNVGRYAESIDGLRLKLTDLKTAASSMNLGRTEFQKTSS